MIKLSFEGETVFHASNAAHKVNNRLWIQSFRSAAFLRIVFVTHFVHTHSGIIITAPHPPWALLLSFRLSLLPHLIIIEPKACFDDTRPPRRLKICPSVVCLIRANCCSIDCFFSGCRVFFLFQRRLHFSVISVAINLKKCTNL